MAPADAAETKIWPIVQLKDGRVTRAGWETIAAAQRLAEEVAAPAPDAAHTPGAPGARVEAVLLGSGIDAAAAEVARCQLAAVHAADHEALATYTPGVMIGVLAPALAAARPDFVLFPHTYQSVDYVPRLAQETGAAWLPEVTGFRREDGEIVWRRPVLAGKLQSRVRVKGQGTVLLSVQSGAFQADAVRRAEAGEAPIERLAVDLSTPRRDREVLGYEQAASNKIDLTKADIIVAVGRGVGGADKLGPVEELARELGAEIGASRPVIDSGWLPRDRQIGSSGQTVAPKLYLALGISGAIQHLVGMKGSSVVVAVNKDPSAPIFSIARYGLVGDLHELVPALTAAVKAARG